MERSRQCKTLCVQHSLNRQNGQLFLHWSRPTPWDAIIKEEGYAELVVDISTFGWYSLVVETSIERCLCSLSVLYLIY